MSLDIETTYNNTVSGVEPGAIEMVYVHASSEIPATLFKYFELGYRVANHPQQNNVFYLLKPPAVREAELQALVS